MKREDLEKLDFTDTKAAIDTIMALNGKDIEKEKKAIEPLQTQLNDLTGENKTLKEQLTEAGATIEKFKSMDIDGIKKAADDYKLAAENANAEIEKTKQETARQIEAIRFDHTLDEALSAAKAKNATAVKALLKKEDLKLGSDGKLIGLDEQLAKVKADNDYLFLEEGETPRIVSQTTRQTTVPVAGAAAWEAAGLEAPTKK